MVMETRLACHYCGQFFVVRGTDLRLPSHPPSWEKRDEECPGSGEEGEVTGTEIRH